MPFCFCGIDKLDAPRKASNLFIAKGGLEKNVGRPCFGCATVSCPYFVNVSELKQRCDDRGVILACTSYPLREYVDDSACLSLAVEHRNATPGPSGSDDVLVKEDPDAATEHQIGAFDDPFGMSQADLSMDKICIPLPGSIEDLTDWYEVLPPHLAAKYRHQIVALSDLETVDVFHTMLRKGIRFADFVRAIGRCSACKMIMAANELPRHLCLPLIPPTPSVHAASIYTFTTPTLASRRGSVGSLLLRSTSASSSPSPLKRASSSMSDAAPLPGPSFPKKRKINIFTRSAAASSGKGKGKGKGKAPARSVPRTTVRDYPMDSNGVIDLSLSTDDDFEA
ncbi:hypothetical protein OF83DRAFT_1151870 [Amylostereum chailletii]|nr:hypothetical protein OF83DRAFT_1151870 [Amylostereum chailletii]